MAALLILGPLRLRGLAGDAALGGDKPRRLLAVLALYANEPVSGDFLTEAIWGGSPPRSARENLQTYIWGLRRAIKAAGAGGIAIKAAPQGYLLRIDADELDWLRFTRAVSAAQDSGAHDPATAAKLLREALGYWHGPVLGGLADDLVLVRPRLAAMEEARLSAVEQRVRAELAVGRHQELLTELAELTGDYPLREQFRALRMIALYRSGRQAEALAVFHDLRALLSAELGIDPAPEVRRLHESILRADPSLNRPSAGAPAASQAVRVPRQLPPPASQFTGRTGELVRLKHLAGAASSAAVLVVVTGSPGVGKTALALHWAHAAQDRFSDGTFFADLRGFDPGNPPAEPAEVLDGFFRAMGLAPQDIPAALSERSALLRTALAGKRALLVLDNAATAAQVRPLLPGGPGCVVLVTSRSRLSGLAVREGAVRLELPPLSPADAVALLARVVGEPVGAEPVAAAQVARLCGGLPLALRVAAERAAGPAGLTGLAAGLADERNRLSVLTTDDDDVAVRAAFGASYRVLDRQSARMFTLCGLQPTREFSASAAAAAIGEPEKVASRLLGKLAGAHLVEMAADGRTMLHDLLAVYASELADGPQRTATVRRLLDWYLYTADAADRQLIPGRIRSELPPKPDGCRPLSFAGYADAFAWCEAERANLVAASRQALAAGELEIAWRVPAAITVYLQVSRRWDAWLSSHETGIDAARRLANQDALAWLLGSLGRAHGDLQDYAKSSQCFAEALAIKVASGDLNGQAGLRLNLGFLHWKQGQLDEGIASFERSLALFRQIGDSYGEAMALNNLGEAHQQLGRYATAVGRLRQALEVFRQTGDMYNQAMVLDSLGNCERMRGQPGQALPFFDEALVLRRRTGDRQGEAVTLSNLAEAYKSAGRLADARRSWQRALAILDELGDPEAGRIRMLLAGSQPLYLFCSASLDAPRMDGRARGHRGQLRSRSCHLTCLAPGRRYFVCRCSSPASGQHACRWCWRRLPMHRRRGRNPLQRRCRADRRARARRRRRTARCGHRRQS